MNKIWLLRKAMSQESLPDAIELLMEHLSKTRNNEAFLESMKG
jgi:transcription termination factor Rho